MAQTDDKAAEKAAVAANKDLAAEAKDTAHGRKVMTEAQARAEAKKNAKNRTADGKVKITLAHPINREKDKKTLGLDPEQSYEIGDTVEVTPAGAASLIGAGLAAVDTEDPVAVAAALSGQ